MTAQKRVSRRGAEVAETNQNRNNHMIFPTLRSLRLCVSLCLLAAIGGCGRNNFELAPVHGNVTIDDKPLFQGKVMFAPIPKAGEENPGRPASGTIQKNGDFRLTTFNKHDGAVVGEHWVTIINVGEDLPDDVPEFARLTAPKKVTVVAGKDNQIDIRLTSDVVKKYGADNR